MSTKTDHKKLSSVLGAFALAASVLVLPQSGKAQTDQSGPVADGILYGSSVPVESASAPLPAAAPSSENEATAKSTPSKVASPTVVGMEGVPKTEAYNKHHSEVASGNPVPVHENIWMTLNPASKTRLLGTSTSDSATGPTTTERAKAFDQTVQSNEGKSFLSTIASKGPTGFEESTQILLDEVEGRGCIKNDNGHGPTCAGINADANGIPRKDIAHLATTLLIPKYERYWQPIAHLPADSRFIAYAYVVNRNPGKHELALIDRAHGDAATLRRLISDDYAELEKRQSWNKSIWDCRQRLVNAIASGEGSVCNGHVAIRRHHRFHPTFASLGRAGAIDNQNVYASTDDVDTSTTDARSPSFHLPQIPSSVVDDFKKLGELLAIALAGAAALAVAPKADRLRRRVRYDMKQRQDEKLYRKMQKDKDAGRKEILEKLKQKNVPLTSQPARSSAPLKSTAIVSAFASVLPKDGQEVAVQKSATVTPLKPEFDLVARTATMPARKAAVVDEGKIRVLNEEKAEIEVLNEKKASYIKAIRAISQKSNVVLIGRASDDQKKMIYDTAKELFDAGELGTLFKVEGFEALRRTPAALKLVPKDPKPYMPAIKPQEAKAA